MYCSRTCKHAILCKVQSHSLCCYQARSQAFRKTTPTHTRRALGCPEALGHLDKCGTSVLLQGFCERGQPSIAKERGKLTQRGIRNARQANPPSTMLRIIQPPVYIAFQSLNLKLSPTTLFPGHFALESYSFFR